MYNRYIRTDDGTYTKVAEPDPPRQETAVHGSQPSPPPPDDPNESGPRSGGPPPSFGGAEGLAGYLRRILDQLHLDRVDAGDLLLLGLLYFLFREKADEELLVALGLLLIGSISLLSAASQVVVSVVQHVPLNTETLISIPLVACGALLMMLIDLPLMFRLGVEKGRIIYILLTCGCVTYFAMNTDDVIASLDTVSVYSALLMVLAITIVAFVISYTISVQVYRVRRG